MTFSEMVTKLIDNIQLKQTVTKIKKYIDQIRNESGVENARRWVIELLQNARDVAFNGQRVPVRLRRFKLFHAVRGADRVREKPLFSVRRR